MNVDPDYKRLGEAVCVRRYRLGFTQFDISDAGGPLDELHPKARAVSYRRPRVIHIRGRVT